MHSDVGESEKHTHTMNINRSLPNRPKPLRVSNRRRSVGVRKAASPSRWSFATVWGFLCRTEMDGLPSESENCV